MRLRIINAEGETRYLIAESRDPRRPKTVVRLTEDKPARREAIGQVIAEIMGPGPDLVQPALPVFRPA
jgi:hypothetical protein